LAQKQIGEEVSAMEVVLAIREKNRRMKLEQYMEKIGLGEKFQQLSRKKNPRRP